MLTLPNVMTAPMPVSTAASTPVVVALDGRESGRGAAAVGMALAREYGARLRIISVLEPSRSPLFSNHRGGESQRAACEERDRRAGLATVLSDAGTGEETAVVIERGCAVNAVIELAHTSGAELIVLGQRDRWQSPAALADDTTLRVVRRAPVPVLAVTSSTTELPRLAIAAIDFSRSSLHAARAAVRILRPGGTLLLVHVQPDLTGASVHSPGIELSYAQGIGGAFDRLALDLAAPLGITVEPITLDGSPIPALAAFAERVAPGLIAVGTGRHDLPRTYGVLRVAAALLREHRHTILTAPPLPKTLRCGFDEA